METPVINRISEFEVGITSINDSSFPDQAFAVAGIRIFYDFWKWGALIFAFLASFATLITRIKSLLLGFRNVQITLTTSPLLDDYDSDSGVSCSSSDEEDTEDHGDGDKDEEEEKESSVSTWRCVDGNFGVKGSGYYLDDDHVNGKFTWRRRRGSVGDLFSWPDVAGLGGSGVVKLWDSLDMDRSTFLRKHSGPSSSLAMVLAAERTRPDAVEVRTWDTRAGIPSLLVEWRPRQRRLGKFVRAGGGGVEKMYVRDDVTGETTVGDIRRVNGGLTDLTESDVETWWNANGVSGTGGSVAAE